jgi:alpha-mannosidase
VITGARFVEARLVHEGPLRGELQLSWRLAVPEESKRAGRSAVAVQLEIHAALTLDAGAPFLRVRVSGANLCRDHRLRVLFHTGIVDAEVWADSSFGAVRRSPIATPPASAELAPPTDPLARYVTLSGAAAGATLFSDGLAEYEATVSGDIAVTLLRAVGELSRNDLPERPGHAGWPVPTPEAQSLGAFEACFAYLPHGARDERTIARVERIADDVLLPLTGATLRSTLTIVPNIKGVELVLDESESTDIDGCLAFSACKATEDGGALLLRCFNLADRPIRARWRLGAEIVDACLARLDETPMTAVAVEGRDVPFEAPPRALVTVMVRDARSAERR